MERRTGPPFRTLAEVRRVGGDAMTLSFGTAPFTLNNATRRGRAEHFLRAFSCEHRLFSGEPRQSLPMNYGQGVFITALRNAFGSGGRASSPGLVNDGVGSTFIQDSFIAHPGHLHMNDAAERTFSIPRSLVTPSARPLTMNDGPRVIGKRTIAGRPGLTCYSIVKESLSKESRFATWEL